MDSLCLCPDARFFNQDMHPLSVEDLLHHRTGHALSKADYYPKHLFIRVLCHTLGSTASQGSGPDAPPPVTGLPRSASPSRFDEKLGLERERTFGSSYGDEFDPMADEFDSARATLVDPEMGGRSASFMVSLNAFLSRQKTVFLRPFLFLLEAYKRRRAAAELTLEELKKEDRVGVHIEPMCIFLFRDGNFSLSHPIESFSSPCSLLGTVISFNSKPSLDLTEPITARIRERGSSLRKSADPCLLVQSLLDLGVSLTGEIPRCLT